MSALATILESRLLDVLMSDLAPCDLGKGIEVVHDVEAVEIEMECDIEDDSPRIVDDGALEELASTIRFTREPVDDLGTHQFERYSAPYARIELVVDANAFVRATIEEAQTLMRSRAAKR